MFPDCRNEIVRRGRGRFDSVCYDRRGGRKERERERSDVALHCTYQHFGEAPLEFDGVRHRLSRRATHAAATRVRSAQAAHAHAQAGLTRVMRYAGLDTADENLAYATIILATATLHDAHVASFRRARALLRAGEYHGRKFSEMSSRAAARQAGLPDAARRDEGRGDVSR